MAEREEETNPLLNELVIDNISTYLSFEELKVCRGLNHLWKKATNKIFLKLCPPILLIYSDDEDDINPSKKEMMISHFMEIYSDSSHPHPFAQLLRQYRNFKVFDLKQQCIPTFYNFLTQVGPQMTSLKLRNIKMLMNSQDLVDIVSSKYSPKLEKLAVHLKVTERDRLRVSGRVDIEIEAKENKHLRRLCLCLSLRNNNKVPWLDVLSLYPNLNALSFRGMPAEVLEEILTALVIIRKANATKLKITELKISSCYILRQMNWETILDLLKSANLPLENISLDNSVSEISLELLQHYRNVLKSLALENHFPEPFPLMEALERMSVCLYGVDLTFFNEVPNLKSLRFQGYVNDSFPKSTPNPLLSLTKLHTDLWKDWHVTELEKLLPWMPNIQNLEMFLNNTTFSWICQHYPNLKELTVLGEELDDSGVVGELDGTLVEGCRPNIANLKELETFKMAGIPFLNKGLTEKSVFYGFALMPKLSKLTINVKSELSADAMLALNRGIRNVHVTVGLEKEEGEEEEAEDKGEEAKED